MAVCRKVWRSTCLGSRPAAATTRLNDFSIHYVADYRSGKKAALYNVSRFRELDVRKLFQALIQVTVGDVEAAKSLVQLV
jgi:hypothetical protein